MDRTKKVYKTLLWIIFVFYILVLIKITLFKDGIINVGVNNFSHVVNYIPFKSTVEIIRGLPLIRVIQNILGNVIIFVPFGFILPSVTGLRKNVVWLGLLFSLAIETTQYFTFLGFADIDDLIYNTLGTFIGFMLFAIIKVNTKSELSMLKISTILIFLLGIAGSAVLIYTGIL